MLSNTYGEAAVNERPCREWFQRIKSGVFNVEDRHGGGEEKIFEDSELEVLFAGDSCQTREKLAESLRVTQQDISKRLKPMRMIQKQGNWVLYELKARDVELRFLCLWTAALDRIERGFYMASWSATKNGSTMMIPSAENHGEYPDIPLCRRPDRIFTVPRLYSEFGRISLVWCIMSCWNRVKPSEGIGIESNRWVWAEHWRRNGHSTERLDKVILQHDNAR